MGEFWAEETPDLTCCFDKITQWWKENEGENEERQKGKQFEDYGNIQAGKMAAWTRVVVMVMGESGLILDVFRGRIIKIWQEIRYGDKKRRWLNLLVQPSLSPLQIDLRAHTFLDSHWVRNRHVTLIIAHGKLQDIPWELLQRRTT